MSTTTNQVSTGTSTTGNHGKRTLTFVAAAAACLGITGIVHYASRPDAIEEYGRVNEEFYPKFTDPTLASDLEVSVIDPETVEPLDFEVKKQPNGQWTIPSHNNYPTDAKDKLGKTAASVIGVKRGAMVTRWPADHARYKVVNPRQDALNVEEVEGVGSRVTLRSDDGSILADYIIGDRLEGDGKKQFYVRHPDEDEVYIADLDIDLSAKFADWIDTELLHLTAGDVTELTLQDYSFEERGQSVAITETETTTLNREKSADPWTMEGLDESTHEIDKTAVRETIDAIAALSVVGVRRKQEGLAPDLRFDKGITSDDAQRIQADLFTRGFLLEQDRETRELSLVARQGELLAATKGGLVYHLLFGRAFTGSQKELEFEQPSTDTGLKGDGKKTGDEETADSESGDAAAENKNESKDDGRPGRYVFVRVEFDDSYLGAAPVKPSAPEMPQELQEAEDSESDADGADDSASEAGETASADSTEADETTDDDEEPVEADQEKEAALEKLRVEYAEAKVQYEFDLEQYESDVKAREKTAKESKEKAEELNRRFADWYYVIPGAEYDKLRLTRSDVIKQKDKQEETTQNSNGNVAPTQTDSAIGTSSDSGEVETTEEKPSAATVDEPSSDDDESSDTEPADSDEKPAAPASPDSTDEAVDEAPQSESDEESSDTPTADEPQPESESESSEDEPSA